MFHGRPPGFRGSEFYTRVDSDPVRKLRICSDWPPSPQIPELVPFAAPQMAICVELADTVESPSPLSQFIDLMLKDWHGIQFRDMVTNQAVCFAREVIAALFNECPIEIASETSPLKAAPRDSLLARLVVCLVQLRDHREFAAVWLEFLNEIGRRSSSKVVIPAVGLSGPQFENCLIFQKLQMLNVCIQGRQNVAPVDSPPPKALLSGEPMVFPTTAMISVSTEDQIEEIRHLLEMNAEDPKQKAFLQSGPLQFEMVRFWEVNPTAEFKDFINWYSPSDFDEATGELSGRMSADGNLWKSLWEKVVSGKELDTHGIFDPVEQAEIALDYLQGLAPLELVGDLLPVAFAAALFEVSKTARGQMRVVDQAIAQIEQAIHVFHRRVEESPEPLPRDDYVQESRAVAKTIQEASLVIARADALAKKFPGCEAAVKRLMEFGEFRVTSEGERDAIRAIFEALRPGLDAGLPAAREFLLSGLTGGGGEAGMQQQLYVAHVNDGVVIALALRELF
jgi:Rab3 GTPase-activating protein catalytic subunit